MNERSDPIRQVIPGVFMLICIAAVSHYLAADFGLVDPMLIAVGIGVLLTNVRKPMTRLQPGLSLHKLLLEIGIVLMGARISLASVISTGPLLFVLTCCTVLLGILLIELLGATLFDLNGKTTSLIAAGASICGVSAVVTVAGSIKATEEDIAYVAGTILLFDAVTMVTYPLIGEMLQLSAKQFGIWAGLSMFSTGPVAAAGFTYSDVAGRWATLTKLARNSLIGLIAILYSVHYAQRQRDSTTAVLDWQYLWRRFPKFLIGFVMVSIIVNGGYVTQIGVEMINRLVGWLFIMAFAGLGFEITLSNIRQSGASSILLLVCYCLTVGVTMLGIVLTTVH